MLQPKVVATGAIALLGVMAVAFLVSLQNTPICLNPSGCKPATRGECLALASSAHTEFAAKVVAQSCSALPSLTHKECQKLTEEWSSHLTKTGGVEWNWPKRSSRAECRAHYPDTFVVDKWVTRWYCEQRAEHLARAIKALDPDTGESKTLAAAARGGGAASFSRSESIDIAAVKVALYPELTETDLAARFFIDSPPNALEVVQACIALGIRIEGAAK